jgi:hypothetical protein
MLHYKMLLQLFLEQNTFINKQFFGKKTLLKKSADSGL